MELSAFNLFVDAFPEPGQTLVYNTFSGGSVVLETAWVAAARAAGSGIEHDPELAAPDLGVIVESRAAEERDFGAWLRAVKEQQRTVSALVSTSYACNLACRYCFQESVMSGRTMSAQTADATIRFLGDQAEALRPERLDLTFIGGEPLLHPQLIERISLGLRARCEPLGVRYGFQIITNGTLMTPDVVRSLCAVGLDAVQVTVDGDACSHDLTRRDKRGRGTFEVTWRNVLACLDLVPIGLQGNYTEDNVDGFLPLLERLRRDGVDPARVPRIKFKPALAAIGTPQDAGVESCTWSNARPDVHLALIDAVRAFGYTPHDPMDLGPCALHQQHHYSIGPEGLLYKCPGFVGKPEWATGSVEMGLTDRHRELTALASAGECGRCGYGPACAGGCIATAWISAGAPDGMNCERRWFDQVAAPAIQRAYFRDTLEPAEVLAAVAALPGGIALPHLPQSAEARQPGPTLVQLRPPPRAPLTEARP